MCRSSAPLKMLTLQTRIDLEVVIVWFCILARDGKILKRSPPGETQNALTCLTFSPLQRKQLRHTRRRSLVAAAASLVHHFRLQTSGGFKSPSMSQCSER